MSFRTKPDIAKVRHEVQNRLQDLRDKGHRIPTARKPATLIYPEQRETELATGFSESTPNPQINNKFR
jgi:hypothetical protein